MILKTNYTFTVRFQRTEVEHRVDAHQPGQQEEWHVYTCTCVHAVAAATPPALAAVATATAAAQLKQQAMQLQQHQWWQVGTGVDEDKQVGTCTNEQEQAGVGTSMDKQGQVQTSTRGECGGYGWVLGGSNKHRWWWEWVRAGCSRSNGNGSCREWW